MNKFNSYVTKVYFSGKNPFDRSYDDLHQAYDSQILRLLASIMNISMEVIYEPRITQIEAYEKNPNAWVVEQLTQGKAEISSTSVILTPDSEKYVAYSVAIGTFRPQIYFQSQSVRMANNIYILPFSGDAWIALISLLLIITVVLTFILARETRLPHATPFDIIARIADEKHEKGIDWDKIDPNLTSKDNIKQREHWEMTEILLVSIGAICQQGSERDPSTAAARTLLLALFVLAVVIYTAYSASVISIISLLPNVDHEMHMGWAVAGNSQVILQDTNFFRYQFETARSDVKFGTLMEGLDSAVNGRAVFVADRDVALTTFHRLGFNTDLRCSLGRAYPGLEYQRVFAMRLNSSYKSAVNYNILKFRQYGLLSREREWAFRRQKPCSSKDRASLSGFVSVNVDDIRPALYLITWGWIISGTAFIVEGFIYNCIEKIVKQFGESWKKAEENAEKVLNRWLNGRVNNEFKKMEKQNQNQQPLGGYDSDIIKPIKPFTH